MLRFFYRWRQRRNERAGAFQLPSTHSAAEARYANFGNYLSQSSVRGRTFARFDLPRRRRQGIRLLVIIGVFGLLAWLIVESIAALALFSG